MLTETGNQDEPMLPSKRKLDPPPISEPNEENQSNKAQKLQSLNHNDTVTPNEEKVTLRTNSSSNVSIAEEKSVNKADAEKNADKVVDEEEKEEEEDDDDDDDFEDEEEKENKKSASVDRKGKGIMIEEDEDSDSDDDDDDDSGSDDSSDGMESEGSELEDDPLAEVDLDNILPSRTRRRVVKPGLHIANDVGNNDDDDSDD